LRNATNEVIGILGIYDDITELKTKTEALRQAEDRYRQLFEASPIPLCVIDNETMAFLAINEAALRQYGYTREESLNKTLRDIFFEEDFPKLEKFLNAQPQQHGRMAKSLVRHRKKDGSAIWLEVSASALLFEGRPARIFQGYDVTRRKHVEEDLRLTKTAIDKSRVAFYRIAPDGVIQYVNEAACQSLGYRRDELIGMRPWEFDPDFPSEAWPEMWAGLRHTQIVHIESRHRRKDGTIFPVQITGNHIRMGKAEYSFTFEALAKHPTQSELTTG
jgi:PAS domain S-box-containing protein